MSKKAAVGTDSTILNMTEVKKLLHYSLDADQPFGIEGPPGIGKSAIVAEVAKERNMVFEPLILSLCDPTDIGGFPVVNGKLVSRYPLGPIGKGVQEPVLLFLDELTMAAPPVQGAAMRLIYERWAGDVKLHPGTRIVSAWNPPDQAAGGYEMALPLMGRLTKVKLHPKHDEVREYFYNIGAEGSDLRRLAVDFAATTQVSADLLQIEPPPGAQSSGKQHGAPRSWERGLRLVSAALAGGEKENGSLFMSALAGNVGDDQAAAFIAIRKVRTELPSEDEILKNPGTAKVPHNKDTAVAALGLIAQVALRDAAAAWIYADRLSDEARVASISTISKVGKMAKDNPRYKEGEAAMQRMLRSIGTALGFKSPTRK